MVTFHMHFAKYPLPDIQYYLDGSAGGASLYHCVFPETNCPKSYVSMDSVAPQLDFSTARKLLDNRNET